jgi:hypothetical protein
MPYRGQFGEKTTPRLQAGEDPTLIARRLTMGIQRTLRGDSMVGFSRPLSYGPISVA